ncbi:hypothetical protein GCM10011316_32790 [Roseibium aquae]|uniref:Methyl-accepting chemotaxis protein n=1 Tax=Roseibium aquae TaxID=1323746 RepID=A0A916TPL2_9HYPH|nr:methyl-accepting chemotaxis protein [Roseibium aquae]GGB58186.1 hypothetical protein GCM10011316_32790 [Roseibium aquae]
MPAADTGTSRTKKNKIARLSVILPALMIGMTFLTCVAVGIGGYVNARSGLVDAEKQQLELLAQSRRDLVTQKLSSLTSDLSNLATGAGAALAFTELNGTMQTAANDRAELLAVFQPEGTDAAARAEQTGSDSRTMYAWRHSELHGSFYSAWKNAGYGDIYAINKDGMVIYSVTKSGDFFESVGGNVLSGTPLASLYEQALAGEKGQQFFSSFAAYGPADGEPSLFVAQPAYVQSFAGDELGGVLVVRIGSSYLDELTMQRAGLGETGQVYMVDGSGTLITNMPLAGEPTALRETVDGDMIRAAIGGQVAGGELIGKDGAPRLAFAEPVSFGGQTWALVAERSVEEALSGVTAMRDSMILMTLLTVLIAAVVAVFFSRSIIKPVGLLVTALQNIASGNTGVEIAAARRGDEIGDIGRAVVQIRENAAADQERRAAEDARAARDQSEQRQKMLQDLASDFEASVGQVVETVTRSVSELSRSAEDMQKMAFTSGETSNRAAQLSREAMSEVQSIASASDQLSSSIQQISSLIERSSAVAEQANERAQSTNSTVRSLAEGANRIGEVVTLISDIADQTNLLALNATIEAARAGDAGKGFAVVASEVKELASQTGKATGEIQQQIDGIRAATDDAVSAIGEIQETIAQIAASVTEVAAAVTEQSFATQGIAENTQRAAGGTSQVSSDIQDVSQISENSTAAANGFVEEVQKLSAQAQRLDTEVNQFLRQVRSA